MQVFISAALLVVAGNVFANDIGHVWPKLLISNDGKDIRLAEPQWNFSSGTGENRSPNDNRPIYHLSTLYVYVDYASPFDISVAERKMFFVRHETGKKGDITGETVVETDIDHPKKEPKVLMKNFFPASDGIAVDWVTKKLYLYNADTHRIEVLDYGRHSDYAKPMLAVLIFNDLFVHSLVVDPLSGYLFWLNGFSDPMIERAGMDGSDRKVLLKDVSYPNSVSVDVQEQRLYWTVDKGGADKGAIWSSNLDGKDKRKIISSLRRPYLVAAFENLLLWGEVDDSDESNPGMYYCDKRSCNSSQLLIRKLKPFTFRIFELKRQPSRYNPCEVNNGNCSHLCLLTPRSPWQRSCACPVGVKMADDMVTCTDGPREVIITAQRNSIRVISLDTPDLTDRRIPIKRIEHAIAVDYDPLDGYVYWLDTALEMIRRVKLNGSGEEDVVAGVSAQAEDLAVDWIAKNVYWTDSGAGRIEVARIGRQSARRILLSSEIHKPRAIIVDPPGGRIYWTELEEESPRIEKAFLDGSNRMTLVRLEEGQWPNGLALDTEKGYLYWVDASMDTLERANAMDGSERDTLWEGLSFHPWGVTVLGNYVYWSDMQHRSLERLWKGKDERTRLMDNLIDITRIKGVDLKRMPRETNECGFDNGGCSHLCLYRPTGRMCMCPLGWELSSDGMQCLVPEGYLLFTRKDTPDIMIASLSRFPANLDYIRLHDASQPFSLDFYYKQRRLYWTGSEGDKTVISRAYLNGSNAETVVDYGLSMGESLAIDWMAEQMYWSDAGYEHIEVCRLNGQSRKIIIWNDIKPRALVVAPVAGFIYWVNWKDSPTIERARLDGLNRVTILSRVGRVSSLALDHSVHRLYWANADSGTINFADVNSDWRPHVLVPEKSMQPYGLTLFGDRLYWADWHNQTIEMCDKNTGTNLTVLHSNQRLVKSLTAVHALKQQGWNGCSNDEKKCDHLCFAQPVFHQPGGFRCDCPTHYTLASDGRGCIAPSSFVLFVQGANLRRFQTLEYNLDGPIATLPYKNMDKVVSIKYDPLNRAIFWMERTEKTATVRRADEGKGAVDSLVLLPNVNPVDFSLDVTTQTIFWTTDQHANRTIRVNRLVDGDWKHLGEIVGDPELSPRSIAVDPLRGRLFFVDYQKKRSSIVRCNLDGTDCDKLLASEEGEFTLLYIDLEDGAVFWFNQHRGSIGRVNSDGTIYRPDLVGNLMGGVSSLTVMKRRLYLVDGKATTVFSVDKASGAVKRELGSYQRLSGVKAMVAVDDTITKRLALLEGCPHHKCPHIYYVRGGDEGEFGSEMTAVCACPLGKKLQKSQAGESECVERPDCSVDEWDCGDGKQCIERNRVCNGVPDCLNGADEKNNCTCPSGHLTCMAGSVKCVPFSQACDGRSDCEDGSDENQCPPGMINRNYSWPVDTRNTPRWDSTVNIIIYVTAVVLALALMTYAITRWCSGCGQGQQAANTQPTLELRVLHPLNVATGQPQTATTTSTTVEYSATCRVTHHAPPASLNTSSSIGLLPSPLAYDERPNLTGKSSSSSDAAVSSVARGIAPKNPPPSLVTVTGSTPSPQDEDQRQHWRKRRSRRRYDYADETMLRAPYSPPPPYTACMAPISSGEADRPGPRTPLLYNQADPEHEQDYRRSHVDPGSRPPPSSPCSTRRLPYENPPPTPVRVSSDDSESGESLGDNWQWEYGADGR